MPIVSETHPAIPEAPDDDTVIWRFMSLSKYLSILTTSCLFFPQLKQLKDRDPFEGKFTRLDRTIAEKIQSDESFARWYFQAQGSENINKLVEQRAAFGPQVLNMSELVNERIHYVSCWHISEHESAGLWSMYAQEGEGLAIRTTVGKLRAAFEKNDRSLYVGRVEYKDFREVLTGTDNAFRPIYQKRLSFSADQELRICAMEVPKSKGDSLVNTCHLNTPGLNVLCDMAKLIEEVRVAPFAPFWFQELISDVNARYNLKTQIKQSSLVDDNII